MHILITDMSFKVSNKELVEQLKKQKQKLNKQN